MKSYQKCNFNRNPHLKGMSSYVFVSENNLLNLVSVLQSMLYVDPKSYSINEPWYVLLPSIVSFILTLA